MTKKVWTNYNINDESKNILKSLAFEMIKSEGGGMYHYVIWSNPTMKFILAFEKGYFESQITPNKSPYKSFRLISLLRFLLDSTDFYKKELTELKKFQPVAREDYIKLLSNHYSKIESFCKNYDENLLASYENFWEVN